jgi:hypothetical protein
LAALVVAGTIRADLRAAAVVAAAAAPVAAAWHWWSPHTVTWSVAGLISVLVGIAGGTWWRERWPARVAYSAGVALIVALAWDRPDPDRSMPSVALAGLYLAAVGRAMAWWLGGPVWTSMAGAFGGTFVGILVAVAADVFVAARFSGPSNERFSGSWTWGALAVTFGLVGLGTIVGAFFGARRKKRRAA